jgi:hypothetical protein
MAKPLDFGEPWTASQAAWEAAWRSPPPVDDPEVLERWRAARDRAKRDADWLVWGARLAEPAVAVSLTGTPALFDDRALVARIHPLANRPEGTPDHAAFARRIAACVTACAGIINPVATIEIVRSLLFDLLEGRADASDPRVLASAARLLRPADDWRDDDPESLTTRCEPGEPP